MLCFLIIIIFLLRTLIVDPDPRDKVVLLGALRCYHGINLEATGFVRGKGAFMCSLGLANVTNAIVCAVPVPPQLRTRLSDHHPSGHGSECTTRWWLERKCSSCCTSTSERSSCEHDGARATLALASSVDPVLYCDTNNGPALAPTVLSFIACSIDWLGGCFFIWAIAGCALHCLVSQSGVFMPRLRACGGVRG